MSGAPVYLRALEKVGVRDKIAEIGIYNRNIIVNSSWVPLDATSAAEANDAVARARAEHIDHVDVGSSERIKSRAHHWGWNGEPIRRAPLSSRAFFQMLTGIDEHITYIEGGPPRPGVTIAEDGVRVIEAAIPTGRTTRRHGDKFITLEVGQVIDAEPEGQGFGLVRAKITGIFQENDRREQYWLGSPQVILEPSPPQDFGGRDLPLILFTSGDSITRGVGFADAGLPGDFNWVFFTDADVLGDMPVAELISMMSGLESQINRDLIRPNVISSLEPSSKALERKLLFIRVPMFLLAALAVTVVAYYLFLVAGLLSRRRDADTVMLRSRGLTIWQVVRMYALEAISLIGVPVLIAPLIALLAVSQLGRLPVFDDATGGATLPVELGWWPWVWSAAAGAVAFLILLAPAIGAARRGVVEEHEAEARPERPPLFQRYFLDVLVLILAGIIWWTLSSRESIVTSLRTGEQSVDFALIFAPALFLIVVALVFLRLFPLAARLASWVASHTTSAPVAVGFWRLGRSPYWYAWPILLLVLVSGLGVLIGSLASTLERSNEEQILYDTGADIHLAPGGSRGTVNDRRITAVSEVNGVNLASPAMRSTGTVGTTSAGTDFTFLAVDAIDFSKIGWFRDDFGETDVQRLLEDVDVTAKPPSIFLPAGTVTLGAWAKADPLVTNLFLWVILKDAAGRAVTVTLGQINAEWTFQQGNLPETLAEPIEITSLQTFQQAGPDGGTPTSIFIDDLTAIGAGFRDEIIDFESAGLWTALPTSNGLDILYSLATEDAGAGTGSPGRFVARIDLDRGTDGGIRGVYRTATAGPLPVIASQTFLAATNSRIGLPFVVEVSGGFVPVVINEAVRYFPTLDQDRLPFLVADLDALIGFLQLRGLADITPNEMFASIDTTRHEEVFTNIRAIFRTGRIADRQRLIEESIVDPLAVAGWRGMGIIGLILGSVATALGYTTYLTAHARRTRHDTAYMRAIGLSRRGFLRIVLIEHALVALLGIGLGIATGILASYIAVDSVAHTDTGDKLLPPFILHTDWLPTVIVIAVATVTATIIILGILRSFPRLPLHAITRMAE